MGVAELAFGKQLRLAHEKALRGSNIRQHSREKILHELERADRFSELETLLGILDRGLVRAHRASGRHPANGVAGYLQHLRGVLERVTTLKAVCFRHANVLQRDVTVLHDLKRDFVFNLVDAEARRGFVFDDETFDLVIVDIARPDDRDVAPRRVADPALLAVKNPRIAVALRGGQKSARRARTYQRFG